MTRFEKELNGALGAYWKQSAEKELEKVRSVGYPNSYLLYLD